MGVQIGNSESFLPGRCTWAPACPSSQQRFIIKAEDKSPSAGGSINDGEALDRENANVSTKPGNKENQ